MSESEDAFRVSPLRQRQKAIVRLSNSTCFRRGTSFCPLKYMLAAHWLVRAGCMWLPWKDALRAACEASSSNHGAGLALAGDSDATRKFVAGRGQVIGRT